MTGTVYLAGAGPGAADLLTLRAARLLQQADVILHDALVTEEVMALAGPGRRVAVGKRAGKPSPDQGFINRLLVRSAQRYQTVVRLKGGDPCLFARADEELNACRAAGIPVEIVPGITAGFAAAASLLAPLSRRSEARSVAFVTPARARNEPESDAWADAAAHADTAVIYMGKKEAEVVRDALLRRGLPATLPAVLAESVAHTNAHAIGGTLAELPQMAAAAGDGPVLLLLGTVFAKAALAIDPHIERALFG
jgi:uroporphyrin-III C-methyltransferase